MLMHYDNYITDGIRVGERECIILTVYRVKGYKHISIKQLLFYVSNINELNINMCVEDFGEPRYAGNNYAYFELEGYYNGEAIDVVIDHNHVDALNASGVCGILIRID